ncbi:uncharacterized protein [Nerophis lumbriciformis]|uniref:uncharacterized protein n=1 Tax=Nerophis lumbriciformis TaxID=546530 RepID=UPI002ADF93CA|nr:uncharacterized protein LOC133571816 [Nerophis lumbriciformis]
MVDSEVRLEALSALCHVPVTSCQSPACGDLPLLSIRGFISATLGRNAGQGGLLIDEDEFFDCRYDFDFTHLTDKETFYRGGELYQRPCGWLRIALRVGDKYPDGNAWLGERGYSTTTCSVAGEWPVSYHGTSKKGAQGIIMCAYQAGPGQRYGRGIYSTPYVDNAVDYSTTFASKKTGKEYQVVLQNRVNPAYRQKHNKGKYWLIPVPKGLTPAEEQQLVDKAIRPYAVLIKQI